MLKYLALNLLILSLTWQVFGNESVAESEIEANDFGINEFNDTDGNIVPRPIFAQLNVNDKRFSFSFLEVNWHTARELCASQNQVLASVNSALENAQLTTALFERDLFNNGVSYWLGGSELGHIGQWSWVKTGRPFFYTNWYNGGPNSYYCNNHCLELLSNGKWNNNDCDQRKAVICEDLPQCSSYDTSIYG